MPIAKEMGWLMVFHCLCSGYVIREAKTREHAKSVGKSISGIHKELHPKHQCTVQVYRYLFKF